MNKLKIAYADIIGGIKCWRIWSMLAWQDIKLRYRRSQLGPFWITLSTTVMIYSMGFLYGHLFNFDMSYYLPYLASGLVTWQFISMIIIESNDAFVESQQYIRQVKLPFSVYSLRVLLRNFIIFCHNLLPIIPILIYYQLNPLPQQWLQMLLGLVIIMLCGSCYGMTLAILGLRFRDLKPIVNSIMQVIFLLTPIMWKPSMLPARYQFAAHYNPFNQLIDLIRAPLMGKPLLAMQYQSVILILVTGVVCLFLTLSCSHRNIVFWT